MGYLLTRRAKTTTYLKKIYCHQLRNRMHRLLRKIDHIDIIYYKHFDIIYYKHFYESNIVD